MGILSILLQASSSSIGMMQCSFSTERAQAGTEFSKEKAEVWTAQSL